MFTTGREQKSKKKNVKTNKKDKKKKKRDVENVEMRCVWRGGGEEKSFEGQESQGEKK